MGPSDRIGIVFGGAPSVPEMVRCATLAEEHGFESAWVAETRITRDAFVPLAAMAQATERITLGTAIVNAYTRAPTVLALGFNGLRELAPGRVVAGLGAGSPGVLAQQGIGFEQPLTRLREVSTIVRSLLRGEQVGFAGDTVSVPSARIEDVLSAAGVEGLAGGVEVPLYLGVTGSRALELAGEMADGVILNICLPTAYVTRARERIAEGARRGGRDPGGVDVTMALVTSVDVDGALARERVRPFVSLYLSLFPNIVRETGLDEALVSEIRSAFHEDGLERASERVPDEVLQQLVVAGTPPECAERLSEYRAAGVDAPLIVPVDGTWETAIRTLRRS